MLDQGSGMRRSDEKPAETLGRRAVEATLTERRAVEIANKVVVERTDCCGRQRIGYADHFTPEAEKARARDEGGEARAIPFLKRFTVFNVAQCEGLRPGLAPDPAPLPERQIVPVAEEVIAASGIDFRVGGNRAFYVPAQDYVQVPPQPAFFEQINYYRTCLHELCHGSGHKSRLNRNLVNSFGSKDYAREELIAEMGSAFLCAALGIVPTVRHADYLGSWLDVLREDSRAIFRAASAASKAADWLLAQHAAAQVEAVQAEAAQDDIGERRAA
ncbi:hypothetical protein TomTYG45_03120 [Sphingobium sp. TomTYG45]